MVSTVNLPRLDLRELSSMVAIIAVSLLVPGVIVSWAFASSLLAKPWGQTTNELKFYDGDLQDGRIWFAVRRDGGKSLQPPFTQRIKSLDIETGSEQETGIEFTNEWCAPCCFGRQLYVRTAKSIYEVRGTSKEWIGSIPPYQIHQDWNVSSDENALTTIVDTLDGYFQFIHLKENNWINGRRILLPEPGRVWYQDAETLRNKLLPTTSPQPRAVMKGKPPFKLTVIQRDDVYHLFITDYRGFAAYRRGFEFADDVEDVASATAPTNAIAEVSGWEPIDVSDPELKWRQMACDANGMLFLGGWPVTRIVRRRSDGTCEPMMGYRPDERHSVYLYAEPTNSQAYLVGNSQLWNSVVISRIQDDTVLDPHIRFAGCHQEYLHRWVWLIIGITTAWLLHVALLIFGIDFTTRKANQSIFCIGGQQATLASATSRFMAVAIDATLLALIVCIFIYVESNNLNWLSNISYSEKLAEALASFESNINNDLLVEGWLGLNYITFRLEQALLGWDEYPTEGRMLLIAAAIQLVALFVAKSYVENRFGATPGQWLVGIRTRRSTLLPVPFVQTLLRDMLCCVDMPFMVTPIPAALSMMFSATRQRIGDRAADTIAIRADSIQPREDQITART